MVWVLPTWLDMIIMFIAGYVFSKIVASIKANPDEWFGDDDNSQK